MLLIHFETTVNFLGVILATIGPRKTQESFSLSKLYLLIDCMHAMVGFELCWEQGWGLGLLDKPGVFGNHTNRARDLDFFSTTLE